MSGSLHVAMALSVAGMVLLSLFALVLRVQPQFVHGLHVDPKKAERNCFIAAACYGVVFILSALTLWVRVCRDATQAQEIRLAGGEALYGDKSRIFVKPGKSHGRGGPHGSRTSSREDTTISLDSPGVTAI